ncbi:MAG TPA: hypothetical protein VH619_00510 [Verrucomicrobiae bacterium]|jgi:hypothetical protein|nr:hypothetical protein [Verrucomicrobiae bacterium]
MSQSKSDMPSPQNREEALFQAAVESLGKAVADLPANARISAAAFAVLASAQQHTDLGANWHDILPAEVLVREARGMIEEDASAAK